jgi:hypothetical protein
VTRQEERARAADEAAQERAGATAPDAGMLSPGYVQVPAGMHPDHNEATVFSPGELLPGWLATLLREQRPKPDMFGVYRVTAPPVRKARK